jgi:hypothetical protein
MTQCECILYCNVSSLLCCLNHHLAVDEQVPSPMLYEQPDVDDIRTEYHPNSKCPTQIDSFEEFDRTSTPLTPVYNHHPWLPFHSKAEFKFAEVALQSAMSNKQLDALINVVHTLMKGNEAFEVKNHRDVQALWDRASESLTPVRNHILTLLPMHELTISHIIVLNA